METTSTLKTWFFRLGMLIVVGSHIYLLVYGLPAEQLVAHSIANFVAAGLIGAAWYR